MSRDEVARDYAQYKAEGRVWGQVPADRITKIKFERTERSVIERYLGLADLTTTVSDLLDSYGVHGVVAASHIKPLQTGRAIVGNAVTLRSLPERKTATRACLDKDPIKMSTREIYYLSEPGDVLVADFGGDLNISNMGGQSAMVAKTSGFAGAIVNGAIRDLPAMRSMDFPVWAAGVTPITGKFRMEAMEINGPVRVFDVVVYPGDLIIADDCGICVVPQEFVRRLIDEAEEVDAAEDKMRDLIKAKAPIAEVKPLLRMGDD